MEPDIFDIADRLQALAYLATHNMPDGETVRSVALTAAHEIKALRSQVPDARPFGPGTLDVLLNAENERAGRIADAIDALAGVSIESEGATYTTRLGGIVVSRKTLAALVRALRGGSQ